MSGVSFDMSRGSCPFANGKILSGLGNEIKGGRVSFARFGNKPS